MTTPSNLPRLQGPEGVLRALKPKLEVGARDMVDRIRAQYAVTEDRLPYFTEVAVPPRQITAVGEYPIVMLKVESTTGRLDNRETVGTRTDDVFERVYRVNAIILTFANTMEGAELLTQRLGLAVRDGVLLDRLLLDTDAKGAGPSIRVLTNDLTERYAEVSGGDGEFVGAAEVAFNVKVKEHVVTPEAYRGGLPIAEDVLVEAHRFLT